MPRDSRAAVAAAIVSMLLPVAVAAQSGTWSSSAAGTYNWGDPANWQSGVVADGAGNTASFTPPVQTGDITVNLASPRTIGGLAFDNSSAGWTIAGGRVLTLGTPFGSPTITANDSAFPVTIAVPIAGTQGLAFNGPGTVTLAAANIYSGGTTVASGNLAITGDAALGTGPVTVSGTETIGATLTFLNSTTTGRTFNLNTGGRLVVNAGATLTLDGGAINGGISGGYLIGSGTFAAAGAGGLFANLTTERLTTINAAGASVAFKNFRNNGTINVAAGNGTDSVTFSTLRNQVGVRGQSGGTVNIGSDNVVILSDVKNNGTFDIGANCTVTATNFTNTGPLTFGANCTVTATIFSCPGLVTFGANSVVTATNFASYGPVTFGVNSILNLTNFTAPAATFGANSVVNISGSAPGFTLAPGTGGNVTRMTIGGTGAFSISYNTRNTISAPSQSAGASAAIDLNGHQLNLNSGTLVNDGVITDGSSAHDGFVNDLGGLIKGTGAFQVPVVNGNAIGANLQAGDPIGALTGRFTLGPGGFRTYTFAIDDAKGQAGPSPDAANHLDGWGLLNNDKFAWTASNTGGTLRVLLKTYSNPTIAGTDGIAGLMDNFDPTQPYVWQAVHWTGTYSGPTSATALTAGTYFDLSGFKNPVAGTFGWQIDFGHATLSIVYTPSAVPEPGTLALCSLAAAGLVRLSRRRPD